MIITKLISGLGNQLFQYTVGRQLSLLHHTGLKLDTSFYSSQNLRSYRLHHYQIEAGIATDAEIKKAVADARNNDPSLFKKVYKKIAPPKPKYKRKYFKEGKWWVYEPEIWKAGPETYIEGYWQHHAYYTNLHECIWKELTIKPEGNDLAASLRHQILEDSNSVSLHIRRGDYVLGKEASMMGVLPLPYYEQAISYFLSLMPGARFYIFSDDLTWAKESLPSTICKTFVEVGDGSYDYLELDLMSKCRHHIIANSSYSWWGAFLNRRTEKQVIAPRQWVLKPEVNNIIRMQMPDWILM